MNINVEIVLKKNSSVSTSQIIGICRGYLNRNHVPPGTMLSSFDCNENVVLFEDVEHIIIDENDCEFQVNYSSPDVSWHVYKLDRSGPQDEICEDDGHNDISVATHYTLPSAELFSLWENLIYEDNIKAKLLQYAHTMMEFTDNGVNGNVISCNRVILLHGPPGTGKTSLCKALAQKLCIRMKSRYKQSVLIEINSHSLFSKWFSESGKLVTKMFDRVREIVEIPKTLVCLLIDEIESLAHARDQCTSGNEPSDSIKVVNAVLMQIDKIKRFPNVIILATSNMTTAIDVAFVDRADIKQFIGPPTVNAIYKIYISCILELIRVNIITTGDTEITGTNLKAGALKLLMSVSEESVNLSGRMLRKIPLLAHALFLSNKPVTLTAFLEAMHKAVVNEKGQRILFQTKRESV